ncbi:REP-associated tyrosine transposase [Tropicibacter sp. S64]|uniref:REP-associated tyrosine transposase n=1 Tax=Tropicibacter sp. S64 TaxID=3415122 RepID=UPI003C79A818
MPRYVRPQVRGANVFFTVCLAERGGTLLVDHVDVLREAVKVTRDRRPFGIDAWVVLPDHMHAVWTLPFDDANYSERWGAIKARFSKFVRLKLGETVGCKPTHVDQLRTQRSRSKVDKQDAGIWQRRFWEHHIRDEADYAAHLRYCWSNPVHHGLVEKAGDWPFSSFHREVRLGLADPEFVGELHEGRFGEPVGWKPTLHSAGPSRQRGRVGL